MATKIKGYNIALYSRPDSDTRVTLLGVTAVNFDKKAKISEVITKDHAGVKELEVDGYDFEFGVEGLVNAGGDITQMDRDDIMDLLIAGTDFDFLYVTGYNGSDTAHIGTCKAISYSEKSDSENNATYSVSFRSTSVISTGTYDQYGPG